MSSDLDDLRDVTGDALTRCFSLQSFFTFYLFLVGLQVTQLYGHRYTPVFAYTDVNINVFD